MRSRWFFALSGAILCLTATPETQLRRTPRDPVLRGPFSLRSYLGKCVTFTRSIDTSSGDPVPQTPAISMDTCNGASTGPAPVLQQRVTVQEINAQYEILIRYQDKVFGVPATVEGIRLELQPLDMR